MSRTLRIGTRRSPLALWQAHHVKSLLEGHHAGLTCELVKIVTQGDRLRDVSLSRFGGKGLFVKEIESALLGGEVDLAVHSMKDMPSDLPAGLTLAVVPPREDPRDAFIARPPHRGVEDLPPGSCIGTSSLRRASQLRHFRTDLETAPARGNVETRLRRLEEGRFDAIILAVAGLKRLGLQDHITQVLDPRVCLPTIGQGALGIETREADKEVLPLLEPLHDAITAVEIAGERALLAAMEGGCHVPVAGQGKLAGGSLSLTGLIASLDGSVCIRRSRSGPPEEAATLGRDLAEEIRAAGGESILEEIRRLEQD